MGISSWLAEGLEVAVVPPPRYQRLIDGISNLLAPFGWMSRLLHARPPGGWHRPVYRVVVRNSRGDERTIAVTEDIAQAEMEAAATIARINQIGLDAWATEMRNRIPHAFFDSNSGNC